MAPATSTNAPTATAGSAPTLNPQGQRFAGDEFSNNLFSDLAPLLTLFGEQVTKQFLSMSMGWADNILLAMGPLGILTVVVSAIRVGGVRKLKALVGRARESLATAEQELLTSTSDSVCEMWSGTDIVRQLGKPKTLELILVEAHDTGRPRVINLKEAILEDWLLDTREYYMDSYKSSSRFEIIASQAPNLALNAKGSTLSRTELWSWTFIGIILQSVAIAFPALTSYLWKYPKGLKPIQAYAYPCFSSGTLAIILGTILCSHVIEGVTMESTFVPGVRNHGQVLQVLRLQQACTVSDQSFRPFLIWNTPGDTTLRTSRLRAGHRLSKLAAFATLLSVGGFICQFVGLRGLHWSATILQLGITLIMTGVRSWVRRGLAVELPCVELKPKYELDMTALLLCTYAAESGSGRLGSIKKRSAARSGSDHRTTFGWEIVTVKDSGSEFLLPQGISTPKLETQTPDFFGRLCSIQKDLQRLMPHAPHDDAFTRISSNLAQSMKAIFNSYEKAILDRLLQVEPATHDQSQLEWSHHVAYCEGTERKFDRISCRWRKDSLEPSEKNESRFEDFLCSILRFWMCSLNARPRVNNQMLVYRRIIGQEGDFQVLEIERWIGSAVAELEVVEALDSPFIGWATVFVGISTLSFLHSNGDASSTPVHFRCLGTHAGKMLAECALELLAGFMGSLAASVTAIGGSTELMEYIIWTGDNPREGLQNSVLRSFSQVLVDCGLVDTIKEANVIVIPPFAKRGLLPNEVGEVRFDEPSEESGSQPKEQNNNRTPAQPAQGDDVKPREQADASGSGRESINDKHKSESRLDGITTVEAQNGPTELVNAEEEETSKGDVASHTLQPQRSATEGEEGGKGEAKQG